MSETTLVRNHVIPLFPKNYLECKGIDVGFGGDKIVESFDGADLPVPYGKYSGYKVDIPCNVTRGIPVPDSTYDVVYSSHLIEDFLDTKKILLEFARICKPGGIIVLVFPDQPRYVEFCRKNGGEPNAAHKIKDMGICYLTKCIDELDLIDTSHHFSAFEVFSYNCIIAFKLKK